MFRIHAPPPRRGTHPGIKEQHCFATPQRSSPKPTRHRRVGVSIGEVCLRAPSLPLPSPGATIRSRRFRVFDGIRFLCPFRLFAVPNAFDLPSPRYRRILAPPTLGPRAPSLPLPSPGATIRSRRFRVFDGIRFLCLFRLFAVPNAFDLPLPLCGEITRRRRPVRRWLPPSTPR